MDGYVGFPRHYLVRSEHDLPRIRQVLARIPDPSLQEYSGCSPLHEAILDIQNNTAAIQELVRNGADVNLTTSSGFTPLHLAVKYRKQRVVDELIQAGALVNAKDFSGKTALHYAVNSWLYRSGHYFLQYAPNMDIILTLLQNGEADYNAVDSNGDTALMAAIKDDQLNVAKFLLQKGANPNVSNNLHETPLHVALSVRSYWISSHLLLQGASIYAKDKNDRTSLDILIKNTRRHQSNYLVKLLLKIVAFKYNITEDLKTKFECIPLLSQFFNKCIDEVDVMRRDFIFGNVTVHDFISNCFNESHFKCILLMIYKPIVERLIMDIYPEFYQEIFLLVPKSNLLQTIEMIPISRNLHKEHNVKDLTDLLSKIDIAWLLSKYLSDVDILSLIAAISNVKIAESLCNLHNRNNNIVLKFY